MKALFQVIGEQHMSVQSIRRDEGIKLVITGLLV